MPLHIQRRPIIGGLADHKQLLQRRYQSLCGTGVHLPSIAGAQGPYHVLMREGDAACAGLPGSDPLLGRCLVWDVRKYTQLLLRWRGFRCYIGLAVLACLTC